MKEWLFNNLGAKIGSILLAVMVLVFVTGQQSEKVIFNVPLDAKDVPSDMWLNMKVKTVPVGVEGQRNIVMGLTSAQIKAYVDLKDQKGETSGDLLMPVKIDHPEGVKAKPTPSHVVVSLEPLIIKEVSLVPTTVGKAAKGYEIEKAIEPKSMVVKGPASELNDLESIPTTPVDISGITKDVTRMVELDSTLIKPVSPQPIVVTLKAVREMAQKSVANVPIRVLKLAGAPLEVKVNPDKATVRIRGPKELLTTIGADDIVLSIDVSNLTKGKYQLVAQADLPPNVKLVSTKPKIFEVTLDEEWMFERGRLGPSTIP